MAYIRKLGDKLAPASYSIVVANLASLNSTSEFSLSWDMREFMNSVKSFDVQSVLSGNVESDVRVWESGHLKPGESRWFNLILHK